jgi:hypothetical protein
MNHAGEFVRTQPYRLLLCGVLIAAGCADGAQDSADEDTRPSAIGAAAEGAVGHAGQGGDEPAAPSFDAVYATLSASCGGGRAGCHVEGAAADLAMPDRDAAYAALVGVASGKCEGQMRVAPGDADGSVLVQALEGTAECVQFMPLGRDPLAASAIAEVRAWIDAGASAD